MKLAIRLNNIKCLTISLDCASCRWNMCVCSSSCMVKMKLSINIYTDLEFVTMSVNKE